VSWSNSGWLVLIAVDLQCTDHIRTYNCNPRCFWASPETLTSIWFYACLTFGSSHIRIPGTDILTKLSTAPQKELTFTSFLEKTAVTRLTKKFHASKRIEFSLPWRSPLDLAWTSLVQSWPSPVSPKLLSILYSHQKHRSPTLPFLIIILWNIPGQTIVRISPFTMRSACFSHIIFLA
jgi:hypothetical protein